MFGWLKSRLGKDESYDDIKSHIIGENRSFSSTVPEYSKNSYSIGENKLDPDLDPMFGMKGPRTLEKDDPSLLRPRFEEFDNIRSRPRPESSVPGRNPVLGSELDKEPPSIGGRQAFSHMRGSGLSGIERIENDIVAIREQLGTIKAQNEIISERIKNLERSFGSERY